jgi:hypothetical protein
VLVGGVVEGVGCYFIVYAVRAAYETVPGGSARHQ